MAEQFDLLSPSVFERIGSNNQWVELRSKLNWECFRELLASTDRTGSEGGRPPYDPVAMLRVVLLGQWRDLSDAELEQALRVRLDFMLFGGFTLSGDVPDRSTIQLFRSKISPILPQCLRLLNRELERLKLKVKSGRLILDSTIIQAAARPRNTISPSDDPKEPPTKTTSADSDAAWTVKGNKDHYGFKEHVLVEAEQGYIEHLEVTPANVHDGTMLKPLLEEHPAVTELLADKAYASAKNREYLEKKKIEDSILDRAFRNRPLTKKQLRRNKRISRRRFRGEQQFGTKKRKFRFARTRYFGRLRVKAQAFLKAIACNLLKALRLTAPPRLALAR